MIGIIAAVSINGIIGIKKDNKWQLPFHYSDDMKYFKMKTYKSTVIMGRNTFESIGKPLIKRNNIVITSRNLINSDITCYTSISKALYTENLKLDENKQNIWFIGGEGIYQEALLYADEIHLTLVPDYIDEKNCVKFPFINPIMFELYEYNQLPNTLNQKLMYVIYKRKKY